MVTKIGLDLGYANITLCDVTAGVCREPSIALVDKNSRRVLAVGTNAMNGSAEGEGGMLVRPFKNGMLYSSDLTRTIIASAVKSVMPAERIRCVIGVPADFNTRQCAALFRMIGEVGVEECYSVRRAAAALVGAGYSPSISAVSVNIGASATEIAVFHGGKMLFTCSGQIGGEDFDRAVRQYIIEQGDMNVSLSIARAIKEKLGAVWEGRPSESIDIEGTLSLTGHKVKMTVCTEDVLGVFEKPLQELLLCIAEAVKKIPSEYVPAVFENGIVLTGGGAELYGIDRMIERVLGVPVHLAQNPIDCVARGLSRIGTFLPPRLASGKDVTEQLARYYESKKQRK